MSLDQLTTALNDRLREVSLTLSGIQTSAASSSTAASSGAGSFVIPPRSITPGHFANTIKPILLVATLPALPNSGYPPGTVVLNEADGILYHNVGGVWQNFINITPGSITTTMIAPGSITTPLLAANSVTALNMAADSVVAGTVAAGAIRASDAAFATAAIQTADIADLAVTSAKIASLDVVKLTASGPITTPILTVQNVGGTSGVVTDITQAVDSVISINTGIVVSNNAAGPGAFKQRTAIGPNGVYTIDSFNHIQAELIAGELLLFNSSGFTTAFVNGPGGNMGVSNATGAARAQVSVDGSDLGAFSMVWGGSTRFAPGVNANGKRMVWGVGTFSGGVVNIATGLTTVEHFSATVANASAAEYLYITGGSGGTVNTKSSLGTGSSSFDWFAIGT